MDMNRRSTLQMKKPMAFVLLVVSICIIIMGISHVRQKLQVCNGLFATKHLLYQYAKGEKTSFNRFGEYTPTRRPENDPLVPVIVTAASSNHFLESQALLKNIHDVLYPRYGVMKIVYFDLGLSDKERQILEKYSNCEVRIFPFDQYSPHLRTLNACTWKPKVILEMMKEFRFVMWVDTSIRFKKSPRLFDDLLLRTLNPETPVIVIKGYPNLMEKTYLYTFQALGEDPQYYDKLPEVGAGWVFARLSNFSVEQIMQPWAKCGLTYGCMGKGETAGLCPKSNGRVGQCHRFDQSVIGIILNRVYKGDYDKFSFTLNQYIDIMREDKVQYLPKSIPDITQ